MLSGSMPNARTASALVETATKCFATAASSPPSPPSSHARAERAFVIVSSVVNVFDETMKSVSSGARSRVASTRSVASTFDTNRNVMSRRLKWRSASYAITGPRSEPPIPMFTTARIGLPVCPVHAPTRTRVGEGAHPVEHLVDLAHDVDAVHDQRRVARHAQRHVQHGPVLARR